MMKLVVYLSFTDQEILGAHLAIHIAFALCAFGSPMDAVGFWQGCKAREE